MSYVTLGAFGAAASPTAQARQRLAPFFPVVRAHREFISKLIVQWLNQNRGFVWDKKKTHQGDAELGVKEGGPKATILDRKRIDMTKVYDTLKNRSNWKNPKYDTMRAAALAVILKRDFVHVLNSSGAVLTGSLGSYVALGETPPDTSAPPVVDTPPVPDTAAAQGAASQADAPAEDIDFGAMLDAAVSMITGILDALSGLFDWMDEQAAKEAAKKAEEEQRTKMREFMTAMKPTSFRAPSRSPFQPAARAAPAPSYQAPVYQTPVYQEVGPDQGAPEAKPFPILPVALGAGALAFLLLRK